MVLDIILILISISLIFLVIIQQRGGSLGTIFGYAGTMPFFQRRGLEKQIYYLTWILAFLLIILSLVKALL